MTADRLFRTLWEATVGLCVALAALVAGALACGYPPHAPEDVRKLYFNGRDEVMVCVLIAGACCTVAFAARFTSGALLGSAALAACGLIATGDLVEVGGYTVMPVLAAALLVTGLRTVRRRSSSSKPAGQAPSL